MNRRLGRISDFGFPISDWRNVAAAGVALLLPAAAPAPARDAAPPSPAVSNVTFVAFDTETTGLGAGRGRLLEIAAVRFRGGVNLATNVWLINPGMAIPPAATAVHGITDAMVRDQPFFYDVAPLFRAFCGDAVLIAHNARFDVSFLAAELRRNDLPPLTNAVLDALRLARAWYPKAPSHKLGALADYLQIPPMHYHRAGADTAMLVEVFRRGTRDNVPAATLGDLMRLGRCPPAPDRKSPAGKSR